MQLHYNLQLFILTLICGSLPLWLKKRDEQQSNYLLAFSGSFLLSVTFLHLLPETFTDIPAKAGYLLLTGFFIQLIIQKFTHGAEHGHTHLGDHGHVPLFSILFGLSFHAFMEGLPLGFNYHIGSTVPSLYLAVSVHKIPEAMLVTGLVLHTKGRRSAIAMLLLFSLITPLAGAIAGYAGTHYEPIRDAIMLLVPVVAGSFIHISTTIFFESGTRQHAMNSRKILAILSGVCLGLLTLIFE